MKLTFVTTVLLLTVSCSNRHMVVNDSVMKEQFNAFASGRKGTIHFKDQKNIRMGKLLRIQGDEIIWTDEETAMTNSAKVSEIHRVSFKDRAKGANFGAATGAGTCVALIVIASADALVYGSKEVSENKPSISSQIIAASYLIFGGTSAGALIGFVKGYETSFLFEEH